MCELTLLLACVALFSHCAPYHVYKEIVMESIKHDCKVLSLLNIDIATVNKSACRVYSHTIATTKSRFII